jgi:hypothetical protein
VGLCLDCQHSAVMRSDAAGVWSSMKKRLREFGRSSNITSLTPNLQIKAALRNQIHYITDHTAEMGRGRKPPCPTSINPDAERGFGKNH